MGRGGEDGEEMVSKYAELGEEVRTYVELEGKDLR